MTVVGQSADLETLIAVIAHSQIMLARALPHPAQNRALPEGFDAGDIAILDWIAAEGRRAGRSFIRM